MRELPCYAGCSSGTCVWQCQSWAQLLIAVAGAQGVTLTYAGIDPNFSTAPATYDGKQPTIDPLTGTRVGGFRIKTRFGQGNGAAPKDFYNHALVLWGQTTILDPSYGASEVSDFHYYYGSGNGVESKTQANNANFKECKFSYGAFSYQP
jgi:hypothetical protein